MDIQALKNGVEAAKAEIRRCEALVQASDGPDPEDHNIHFKRGGLVQVSAGMLDAYKQLRMARQIYCAAYYAWINAVEPSGQDATRK